ncbi:MAG: N-acetylmuramic acid 6-phosphate etherase [Phycisphaerales bacterium]
MSEANRQPKDALPPDRSGLGTEARHPASARLHAMSATECVALLHEADREAVAAAGRAGPAIARFVEAVMPGFAAGGRLIYVGAGTSGRLGVLDASEAPPTFCVEPGRIVGIIAGGDASLRRSSEGMEDDPNGAAEELTALVLSPHDSVLGIAAGGTTPYVLGALRLARDMGAGVTGLLTCARVEEWGRRDEGTEGRSGEKEGQESGGVAGAGSHRSGDRCHQSAAPEERGTREHDHLILCETGPEVLTGSTRLKAGTATKLVLNAISTTLMVRTGRVYQNLMVDVRATNDKLKDRAARIVSTLTGLDRAAAFAALERGGWSAKTTVVMRRFGVDRAEAEWRLAAVGGRLGEALSDEM